MNENKYQLFIGKGVGALNINHLPHLAGWTKEEFIERYKGKVTVDLNNAWLEVQDRLESLGIKKVIDKEKTVFSEKRRSSLKEKGSLNINKK